MPLMKLTLRRIEYHWIILGALLVLGFFNGGSRFAIGLMLKPMAEDLDWKRATLSLVVTTSMLVSALAMPLAGHLADRLSVKGVLAMGVAASAIGIGLTGRVTAQWHAFMAYGGLHGLGSAGSSIATVGVLISRWYPQRTGTANAVASASTSMGQLLILAALASFLPTLGWRNAFQILGAASLFIAVPVILATIRSRPPAALSSGGSGGDSGVQRRRAGGQAVAAPPLQAAALLTSPQLWLLLVAYAICGFQDFFMVTHVVAFADDQGVGPALAGNLLALMGVMGLAGVLASGVMADARGATRPAALCFVMRIAIFGFIIYFQNTPAIVAFALAYGFTFMITAPLVVVFARNIFGAERTGTVSGLIIMAHQVAGATGAYLGAVIFDTWGSYDRAFVLMVALAVVATALTLRVRERPMVRAEARA